MTAVPDDKGEARQHFSVGQVLMQFGVGRGLQNSRGDCWASSDDGSDGRSLSASRTLCRTCSYPGNQAVLRLTNNRGWPLGGLAGFGVPCQTGPV